jgi:hypothetical protein
VTVIVRLRIIDATGGYTVTRVRHGLPVDKAIKSAVRYEQRRLRAPYEVIVLGVKS